MKKQKAVSLEDDTSYATALGRQREAQDQLETLRRDEGQLLAKLRSEGAVGEELADDPAVRGLRHEIAKADRAVRVQNELTESARRAAVEAVIAATQDEEQRLCQQVVAALGDLWNARESILLHNAMLQSAGVPHALTPFVGIKPALLLSNVVRVVDSGQLSVSDVPATLRKAIRRHPDLAGSVPGTARGLALLAESS